MISIIIPAYNAAQTLPACLAALLRQTHPPDEIIVVDDGSTDCTPQVARDNKVKLLEQPHQGPAAARNLGMNEADGDLVLFTDADCEPVPTWVAEMLRPFSDPQVVGVKGSYHTNQKERVAQLVQIEFEERYDRQEGLPAIDVVDSSAAAFRVAILNDLGGFDPAFPRADNEDVELSYRLETAGYRLVFNRQAVVYHRHPSTWRAYLQRKIRRGYWRMLVYRFYPGKAVHDSYTPQLLKTQIALMYLGVGLTSLTIFLPQLGWGAMAAWIVLLLSAIPFARRAMQQEKSLLFPALFFIFIRALAFAIGVAGGIVGMFFFRPTLSGKKEGAVSHGT